MHSSQIVLSLFTVTFVYMNRISFLRLFQVIHSRKADHQRFSCTKCTSLMHFQSALHKKKKYERTKKSRRKRRVKRKTRQIRVLFRLVECTRQEQYRHLKEREIFTYSTSIKLQRRKKWLENIFSPSSSDRLFAYLHLNVSFVN